MIIMSQTYIDRMVVGYLAAAAWSTCGGELDETGNPEHESLEAFEFSAAAEAKALKDCQAFLKLAGTLVQSMDPEQVGHDFWLTREGHGVGFWDRGLGEVGDKLAQISDTFGSGNLELGDDELLYFLG